MLILTVTLMALVFAHQMPDHNSTYSDDTGTDFPLGSAYYVDFSSTTLAYIASLSSTFATVLISAGMMLFSYPIACEIAVRPDDYDIAHLPTLFQLQLLIRMIDGRVTALWSYFMYLFSGKQRK